MKNILITGAGGYIGSKLCRALSLKHEITAVDNLIFNQGHLIHHALYGTFFYNKDVEELLKTKSEEWFQSFDVFLPMSCLVGMPIVKNNPALAQRTNLDNIVEIMTRLRPDCQVIIPSTNSGYGEKSEICTEETPLNSVSLYGKLKEELEKKALERDNVVVFRLATVFGLSFRNRVDLLINCLTYDAFFDRKIDIFDNGFLRNYIHVEDVVKAFIFTLNNFSKLRNNIFNLGNDKLNCTKEDLAKKIQRFIPGIPINNISGDDPDRRNYRVGSDKFYSHGFKPQYGLEWGITELMNYYSYLPKDKAEREKITKYMRNDQFKVQHE